MLNRLRQSNAQATLADLDAGGKLAGFDWIWLLSVWQTSTAAREVSRKRSGWLHEFQDTLPDLKTEDIGGSGFAIADYKVSEDLGGAQALAKLRQKLKQRGQKLMLDFVPNHMGLGHRWLQENPAYFIMADARDAEQEPHNYFKVDQPDGKELYVAHGRDPYFEGWPDTIQLDYSNPALQEEMIKILLNIAGQCDGVRCDMAMLVEPEIFERTWKNRGESRRKLKGVYKPFWSEAISRVKVEYPDFCFMAEVYWDMEWQLQQAGFDYTYDKRLYDRLRNGDTAGVRAHLAADLSYQSKMARFLENHDEPRAAAVFSEEMEKAAAVTTFLTPGLRFFHQGQFEGFCKRISPHLVRGPEENENINLKEFYNNLLAALIEPTRTGTFTLLGTKPAWQDNWTYSSILGYLWQKIKPDQEDRGQEKKALESNGKQDKPEPEKAPARGDCLLAVVNLSDHQSQCYLPMNIAGCNLILEDKLSNTVYERKGDTMSQEGLYLDMSPFQCHIFAVYAARSRVN